MKYEVAMTGTLTVMIEADSDGEAEEIALMKTNDEDNNFFNLDDLKVTDVTVMEDDENADVT